jgi:hypothetical protein
MKSWWPIYFLCCLIGGSFGYLAAGVMFEGFHQQASSQQPYEVNGYVRSIYVEDCYSEGCMYQIFVQKDDGGTETIRTFSPAPPIYVGMHYRISFVWPFGVHSWRIELVQKTEPASR